MTGSLAAQITIPIVAFILLGTWLAMVYHADSHPGWRGRSPARPQLTTQLPSQAAATAAETGTTLRIPAQSTDSPVPMAEPAQSPEPSPTVPAPRAEEAKPTDQAGVGATATPAAGSDHPSTRRGLLTPRLTRALNVSVAVRADPAPGVPARGRVASGPPSALLVGFTAPTRSLQAPPADPAPQAPVPQLQPAG